MSYFIPTLVEALHDLTECKTIDDLVADTGLPPERCEEIIALGDIQTDKMLVRLGWIYRPNNIETEVIEFFDSRAECTIILDDNNIISVWIGLPGDVDERMEKDLADFRAKFDL